MPPEASDTIADQRQNCSESALSWYSAAGTMDINDYIDKDQSNAPKGTLSLVYNAGGYGGPAVELNYQIAVPFTNLSINKRVLTHTSGN